MKVDEMMNSPSKNMLMTVAKSLKYACPKNPDRQSIGEVIPNYIKLSSHGEHEIRRFSLESLVAVAFHKHNLLKTFAADILEKVAIETKFREDLIVEIDLGPFKHKTDEGRGLRQAGFSMLQTMLEKIPDKVNSGTALDIVINGLKDPDSDCQTQTLQILMRLMKVAPGVVQGQMNNLIDHCSNIIEKQKKASKTNVTNLMRIVLKAIVSCKELPDIENNSHYQEFMVKLMNDAMVAPIINEISQ